MDKRKWLNKEFDEAEFINVLKWLNKEFDEVEFINVLKLMNDRIITKSKRTNGLRGTGIILLNIENVHLKLY